MCGKCAANTKISINNKQHKDMITNVLTLLQKGNSASLVRTAKDFRNEILLCFKALIINNSPKKSWFMKMQKCGNTLPFVPQMCGKRNFLCGKFSNQLIHEN